MSKKLVLIDGHSILNRAYFGIPNLSNSKGLHTNAVYGFLNILFRILDEEQPDYLTVAFDVSAPTFRHKMYADYKGTRKPMDEELREQVPVTPAWRNSPMPSGWSARWSAPTAPPPRAPSAAVPWR